MFEKAMTRATLASVLVASCQAAFSDWQAFAGSKYQIEEVKFRTLDDYNLTMIKIQPNLAYDEPAIDAIPPPEPIDESKLTEQEKEYYDKIKEMKDYDADGNEITEEQAHRIAEDKRKKEKKNRGPLFLNHGTWGSADNWIKNSEHFYESLPFLFADFGYEVWVGNSRGTVDYSSNDILDKDDEEFWEYDYMVMSQEDLAASFNHIRNNANNPNKKGITYVGLERSSLSMLYTLVHYEQYIYSIIERAIYLAPQTWTKVPGPSFADPIMDQIKSLEPPYVGGPDWPERRAKICEGRPENEELCAHPFMAETEETLQNPLSVQEWEVLSQNSDAEVWQERIPRESYKTKGLKGTEINLRLIRKTKSFIIHPKQSKTVTMDEAKDMGYKMVENFGVFHSDSTWQDYYNKSYKAFSQIKMSCTFSPPSMNDNSTKQKLLDEKEQKEQLEREAIAAEKAAKEQQEKKDQEFVMEGSVVERDQVVIEGQVVSSGEENASTGDSPAQADEAQAHTDEL